MKASATLKNKEYGDGCVLDGRRTAGKPGPEGVMLQEKGVRQNHGRRGVLAGGADCGGVSAESGEEGGGGGVFD